ncbi:melatonin receptor type 1B-B-like [Ptychodera flava]|uniref:melatonin receptor type 1B-B-like n=1 Tax=Ptychodera flava TaxID=63121 RepID=UPI00396A3F70
MLMDLPNFLGWGGHVYDHKTMVCTYERTASYSYTLFFLTLSVFLPLSVVCFCYLKVYLLVRTQRHRIASLQVQFGADEYHVKRKDIQLLKTFFAIFIVFFICWGPYAVIVLVDFEDVLPQWLHIIIITMAHGNSSLNSVLYGVMNKQFREGYYKVLSLIGFCPRSRVNNAVTTSSLRDASDGTAVLVGTTSEFTGQKGRCKSKKQQFQPREPHAAADLVQ